MCRHRLWFFLWSYSEQKSEHLEISTYAEAWDWTNATLVVVRDIRASHTAVSCMWYAKSWDFFLVCFLLISESDPIYKKQIYNHCFCITKYRPLLLKIQQTKENEIRSWLCIALLFYFFYFINVLGCLNFT